MPSLRSVARKDGKNNDWLFRSRSFSADSDEHGKIETNRISFAITQPWLVPPSQRIHLMTRYRFVVGDDFDRIGEREAHIMLAAESNEGAFTR
jgi:hypothetical protein